MTISAMGHDPMFSRLLVDTISLVFGNPLTMLKACGAWIVLQVAALVLAFVLISSYPSLIAGSQFVFVISFAIAAVLTAVSLTSISVAWHRFGVLNESPALVSLNFSRIEFIFLIKNILLSALAAVPFLIFYIANWLIGVPSVSILVGLLLLIFALPTFMRLSLVLPATAVDRRLGLLEAYSRAEGLGWYMVFASILMNVPLYFFSYLFKTLVGNLSGQLPAIYLQFTFLSLDVVLRVLATIFLISVITAGYNIAMERYEAGT